MKSSGSGLVSKRCPRLLVEWESPLRSFLQAIPAALARSPRRLESEQGQGHVSPSAMAASMLWHVLALLALLWIPANVIQIAHPLPPAPTREYTLTYLPLSLPAMDGPSGAETGKEGKAGGKTAASARQTVRVSLAKPQLPLVYEPPRIALPHIRDGFANLVVVPSALPLPAAPDVAPLPKMNTARRPEFTPVVAPPPPEVAGETHPKLVLPVSDPAGPPVDASHLAHSPAPMIPGVPVAQPASAAPRKSDAGMLISSSPGATLGVPSAPVPGTLVTNADGKGDVGAGGSGGGDGTGKGSGPGSGAIGAGPGGGTTGTGYGDSTTAKGGISPGRGPGGTGTGTETSPVRGLSIAGGPTSDPGIVYLPGFGPPAANASSAQALAPRRAPEVTIIATSRAGGALPIRGLLDAPRVYTIYLQTSLGRAVLEFAELNNRGYNDDLTAPDPLVVDLPAMPPARTILSCVIDRSGVVRGLKLIETTNAQIARLIMDALPRWKFRPVLRRDTPIDVAAVLAFDIDVR